MPAKKKPSNISFTPAPIKSYLRSGKTLARSRALASSASSSAAMSASSIPVSSSPAVAASEPLAPESSPSKPANVTDRVASTARDLINVPSSPPSRHSPSDASLAGPSSRAGSPTMMSRNGRRKFASFDLARSADSYTRHAAHDEHDTAANERNDERC